MVSLLALRAQFLKLVLALQVHNKDILSLVSFVSRVHAVPGKSLHFHVGGVRNLTRSLSLSCVPRVSTLSTATL